MLPLPCRVILYPSPVTFGWFIGLFFTLPAVADSVPDTQERAALEALYQATNGNQWYDNTNWLSNNDLSTWYGVSMRDGDVVALDLSFNDLSGILPSAFYDLSALEELYLGDNYLEGTVSEDIAQLQNLVVLDLQFNRLHGPIPKALGQLQNLEIVILVLNNLEGPIPAGLGSLPYLQELDLGANLLSGTIPSALGQLSELRILWLGGNILSGSVPASLGGLTNLVDLNLSENLLSGTIPKAVLALPQLEQVDLGGNEFQGTTPYFSSPALESMILLDNQYHSLANYSNHPNAAGLAISVWYNALDFADIIPLLVANQIKMTSFLYQRQDSLPTFYKADSYTYSVEVGGTGNQYQWLKNGTAVPGATTDQLVLTEATYRAEDVYQCEVTNPQAPHLTLISRIRPQVAGQFYAVGDGRWTDAIWAYEPGGPPVDNYPQEDSEVFIVGHNVTVDQPLTTGSVHVVVDQAPASLVVDGAEMTIYGELDLTKQTEGFPGHVKVINDGRIMPLQP